MDDNGGDFGDDRIKFDRERSIQGDCQTIPIFGSW